MKLALVILGLALCYIAKEVWRALQRVETAKSLAQSAERRINAGENPTVVRAELVAMATAQECDDIVDDIVDEYEDELPNLAALWEESERKCELH